MATRRTLCTQCDRVLDIAPEAKSVNCPHCHTRVVTEEMDVGGYVAVSRFAIANRMRIAKKGLVYASVRADYLDIEGFLQGEGVGLAGIRVGKHARVKGNLRGAHLVVEPGAVLSGDVRIGLAEVPEIEILRPASTPPAP